MAHLMGLAGANGVQFVRSTGGSAGSPSGGEATMPDASGVVIDGTPVRIVILALAAAAGLTALKWAGIRFNVGVTS